MSTFGRTGRVSVPYSTAPTFRQSTEPQLLCTYQSDKPHPLTLMLSAAPSGSSSDVPVSFFLPSNVGGEEYSGMAIGPTGIVAIEYGSGSALNRIFADLRPGTYALPPCEFARASIIAFHPNASFSDGLPGFSVAGTLFEGQHKNPARLTSTLIATVDASQNFAAVVPAQARWVDIEGGNVQAPLGTVVAAKIRFLEERYSLVSATWEGAGRYIVRDEAAGIFPDPMPVELATSGSASAFTSARFRVWNDGAAAADITVKFFLEL